MRITLNISDALFAEVKKYAAAQNRTITSIVEEGLRRVIHSSEQKQIVLPFYEGDGRLLVNLADIEAMSEIFDEEDKPLDSGSARYRQTRN